MSQSVLECCTLCPRRCGVNRMIGEIGFCGAGGSIKAARASLHHWEEPCLSGTSGSGTVFFSHCTLQCVYCQNNSISTHRFGAEMTPEELADTFLSLQEKGAHNINLVTPTHFVPQIVSAINIARKHGLYLPFVYNTGGYETVETLQLLDGLIDIYLPDFKYWDDRYAIAYSQAPHYAEITSAAIGEMVRQVGLPRFRKDGIMRKGVIIRHLMLPGLLSDTKQILRHIAAQFGDRVYVSLMNQYTPLSSLPAEYEQLHRTISEAEYHQAIELMQSLGLYQGFLQEGETALESFIPDFDLSGLTIYQKGLLEESK